MQKGDLVADRYQIITEVSRGVLGTLYQVKDTHFKEQYLHLKMLHPRWSSDPLERKRFSDEINICIDPVNPPRVQVDHRENGQTLYFYLTGLSLQYYMDKRKEKSPPFSLSEIRTVILALLDILDYAHQYTVHNQISPSTIIVLGSFPDTSIRLLDYGVGDNKSATPTSFASPDTSSFVYMAPEQIRTPLETDLRSDLYSVGVILYQMITGREAVGAFEMPSEIFSNAYEPLDKIIKKVLSPKADLRYSTAMAFSNAIADALNKLEQPHDKPGIEMAGSSNEEHKIGEESTVENDQKTKELPGKLEQLNESRFFLLIFVVTLLFLGGGVYVLLNNKVRNPNTPISTMAADGQGSIVPIEPIDTRNKDIQNSLQNRELTPVIIPEIGKKILKLDTPETSVAHLTVSPRPTDSNIRILNIKPPYEPNMALAPGRYQIEVSAPNHESLTQWVVLPANDNLKIEITLQNEEEIIPAITTGHLVITPSPAEATIRILNIKPPYEPNMLLDAGRYLIEISASGYESLTQWVDLSAEATLNIAISLDKIENTEKEGTGVFIDPSTGMEFKYITGGCYSMGQSPAGKNELIKVRGAEKYKTAYSDETPKHEVCVDGFYMGKYEVTVEQWNIFIQENSYQTDAEKNAGNKIGCYSLKNNKWIYAKGRYWNNLGFPQSANSPVACISHNDVTQYINWLNLKSDKQYRLPTEAEWEYAARGGTKNSRFWGDAVDKTACQYANVANNKRSRNNYFPCDDGHKWSSPVGSFNANDFDMYDMLGNVWEWCSDKYKSNYYLNSPRSNPPGASSGQIYAIRGGSWNGRSSDIRAANRNWAEHNTRKSNVGFRLVTQTTGE